MVIWAIEHPENKKRDEQNQLGKHIKDVVYGGLDGLITTFAIVSGVAGASLSTSIVLILGFANLIADGFSMAVGNYLGTKSEIEYANKEREKEEEYIESDTSNALEELRNIYRKKGFQGEDLDRVVSVISSNKKLWIDTIMQEEFGIIEDSTSPLSAGVTTFLSFFTVGLVPLLTYVVAIIYPQVLSRAFQVTLTLTGLTIFSMGAIKSKWTGVNWFKSGLEMLVIGGAAALFAYLIGFLLREFKFEDVVV